jgi:hypothetical protein
MSIKKDYKLLNKAMKDPRLSMKAKGVYSYLFSQAVDWEGQIHDLVKHSADGTKSIMSAAKELRECGYITTVARVEKGLFRGKYYRVNRVNGNPNNTSPSRQYVS